MWGVPIDERISDNPYQCKYLSQRLHPIRARRSLRKTADFLIFKIIRYCFTVYCFSWLWWKQNACQSRMCGNFQNVFYCPSGTNLFIHSIGFVWKQDMISWIIRWGGMGGDVVCGDVRAGELKVQDSWAQPPGLWGALNWALLSSHNCCDNFQPTAIFSYLRSRDTLRCPKWLSEVGGSGRRRKRRMDVFKCTVI